MNVRRFTARTSRDALGLVKQALGNEAVVLSTRPCAEGVEVLAMTPDAVASYEAQAPAVPVRATPPRLAAPAPAAPRAASLADTSAAQDAERLAMSTLSFQDYVRERMLRRRRAEMQGQSPSASAAAPSAPMPTPVVPPPAALAATARLSAAVQALAAAQEAPPPVAPRAAPSPAAAALPTPPQRVAPRTDPMLDADELFGAVARQAAPPEPAVSLSTPAPARSAEDGELLQQLREMRGLIEQRFGALTYLEKLRREPRQAQLSQRLLEAGFCPLLTRRLADNLPPDGDEWSWAAQVLERNLQTGEREAALEDTGGVYALIGSTGVGKTTSTAKLAAAFATRHGSGNLGLITLDAYRVAAHEQLRAYGKILGVPVHTAHDRASLEDLLDLLSGKRMVLIDTAGMAQRDERTRELLDMLGHRSVHKLLVLNAAQQGDTIDDVIAAYRGTQCRGVVLSKLDEAVKLGPALDALIRHKLKVLAVANGQRVPEDWHRLSAGTLVQRALRVATPPAWKLESEDVSLVFTDPRNVPRAS
ncbi:MAG: flagellar biosynthesis protein FlhF [Rubrivivax sp.]|nr:flagellar biosynthesis protein FlhF [Rubrivivax sp.]